MHRVFLCLAAAAIAATPATAQNLVGGMSRVDRPPPFIGPPIMPPHRGDGPRDHRRHGHDDDGFAYGYAGYYYPSDFDGNRSWDPDRWNDWWHERPERAFPRWVWRNQNFTEDRMWWSGAGWRCTP